MCTTNKKLKKFGTTTNNNQISLVLQLNAVPPQEHPSSTYLTTPFNRMRSKFSAKDSVSAPPPKWTPLVLYAQAIRECVNARFISHAHKVAQNITQAQRNAIRALKINCNIVIKPADKGGAIVIQNRMDYCKEVYRQLNNQKHYRQLFADLTKEHTLQLNRLIKTFVPVLQITLHILIPRTSRIGDFYCLPKIHKANTPGRPIVLDANLQLICFTVEHNAFTFDNQFFIQTHGTAMGTEFAPQYVNIFKHRFEQEFFADALIGTGYHAQLIDRRFRHATVNNRNDLLRRQTQDTPNRVPFDIQYFLRPEKLRYVLCNLQHIINDDEHLGKIFPMSPLLTFKQLPNLKQTTVRSKLPSLQDNINHNTIQPCYGNLCKTYQIIDMDTTITHGNTTHHVPCRYS
eukprot:g45073.t1